ncbi:RNA polymerase sigma-70 factor (ECF subfamily) [Rhizobium rosettiformans]|uniref:Sigma-70 family RNA polymerase sigma factor n=2 Tax=Rhizobium rosettiformans TaxID=1368430 RepID=A0A4S8Q0Y3_9HYPH|nr:sigma-70 family RNA polymerase sigma factor [Rhizobium rosettiformans]MBB5276064.1 RNA polymerase sigma-70 factor (ECF subfamily) [Rhizobium rosettiformans]THV36711.1 sigma-70 family RNA polymerase sigma factor [Rhizobium rosettiformans W3]
MRDTVLDETFRVAGGRIRAALAARYRDLDLAEEAFAESCLKAVKAWGAEASDLPRDPAAWLYRVAERAALDILRRRRTRAANRPDEPEPEPTAEDRLTSDDAVIPDERLKLIFVCCHPAVAADSRAALTLKLVCGLSTEEVARAFLVSETTLAQRLVRAKRKIAEAGVSFEVPGPQHWAERLAAVLSTLEVAYAKAHEDAAGSSRHAGFAREMLEVTALLAEMLPQEAEVLALAATIRFAESRRPARMDADGVMVPLAEQDPVLWSKPLIEDARRYCGRALGLSGPGPRILQMMIHALWCGRKTLADPPPWKAVLAAYDILVELRDDPVIRINRAVALAEVAGAKEALAELDGLNAEALSDFLPFHAARADLLARLGRVAEAIAAYDRALALSPGEAERRFLEKRREALGTASG